jgi:hypothetical protein
VHHRLCGSQRILASNQQSHGLQVRYRTSGFDIFDEALCHKLFSHGCNADHGEDADIDEPLMISTAAAAAAAAKPKLSTEEQKQLLEEKLAKLRAVGSRFFLTLTGTYSCGDGYTCRNKLLLCALFHHRFLITFIS